MKTIFRTRNVMLTKRVLSIMLSIVLLVSSFTFLNASTTATAASKFTFNGSMSEEVLKNYLSRAVTFQGLCAEAADSNLLFYEDLRMIRRTGAKFVSRAAVFAWTSTNASQVEKHYTIAAKYAKEVHKADPEIILQGFVAEIVRKSYVNKIKIPAWVFKAFGKTPENRNFNFDDIIDDKLGPDYWGTDAGYPDYGKEEALMWYYYCICKYIDAGYESIHIQEGENSTEYKYVDKLLTMCRSYAKTHARRGIVLFHNFFNMDTGGNKIDNRLLFDINGNGLVPNETVKQGGALQCRIGSPDDFWCTWFGRSAGGEHPLGFKTDICPTLLEFDNYGQQGKLGVSNGQAFGTWGYDDITWFASQPEWYRNEFLLYLDEYMSSYGLTREGKQAYFCLYPMRRVITADPKWPVTTYTPGKNASSDFLLDYCAKNHEHTEIKVLKNGKIELTTKEYYRANRQSDACPNGFNQEDTIREIFLGKNAPEKPELLKVKLPAGYKAQGPSAFNNLNGGSSNNNQSGNNGTSDDLSYNSGFDGMDGTIDGDSETPDSEISSGEDNSDNKTDKGKTKNAQKNNPNEGMPLWMWIAVIVGGILVLTGLIALVVFLFMKIGALE